jgi:hypothetical protein
MDDFEWAGSIKMASSYVQISDEMAHDNGLCTCP